MEEIINNLENLIDDIERDASLTNEEITENLYNIKQQLIGKIWVLSKLYLYINRPLDLY